MCETNENAKLFIVLELLHIACICMFNILSRTKSYQFQIKLPVIFPSMGGEARGGDIPYTLSANRWPFSSVEIYSGVASDSADAFVSDRFITFMIGS